MEKNSSAKGTGKRKRPAVTTIEAVPSYLEDIPAYTGDPIGPQQLPQHEHPEDASEGAAGAPKPHQPKKQKATALPLERAEEAPPVTQKAASQRTGASQTAAANAAQDEQAKVLAQKLIKSLEACRKTHEEPVESWRALHEASYPAPKDHTRLILACAAGAAAIVVCWFGLNWADAATTKVFNFETAAPTHGIVTASSLRRAYLEDVRTGREQLTNFWAPGLETHVLAAGTVKSGTDSAATKTVVKRSSTLKIAKSGEVAPVAPPMPEPADTSDPAFARIHGSAKRYRASAKRVSAQPEGASATSAKSSALGQIVHASLSNQLASNAAGTMALAVVTRKVTVGSRVLPVGAELTGTIGGGDNTRVFVDFTAVRLPDGQILQMSGKAADSKGRNGLPGVRQISRRSVASVGISSGNSMLVEAGQVLGGNVGGIIGRGIASATSSAAEKTSRADRDEYVVIVDRGAMFTVIIEHIEG